ncbi:MAG: hypothetical protein HY077_18760 [Elusimicrobia bacterium]|nr:hypothetical protein [Elusimicrobiota bacterium]
MRSPDARRRWAWAIAPPVFVAAATALCFLPALKGGFLIWDDRATLVDNAEFLSHGWRDPHWMLTTTVMTVYQPLTWLSYGADYGLWGLDAAHFHLTSLLLHGLCAVIMYFLSLSLLPGPEDRQKRLAAAFSALIFSLHPLRAEAVAWITERREVLADLFLLLALLAYLKRRIAASCLAYGLCLLSKNFAIGLPLILVVLDALTLGRLPPDPRRWGDPRHRDVLLEKAPFALLAIAATAAALAAQGASGGSLSLELYGLIPRLCKVLFTPGFYLWKTLAPLGLAPWYELSRLTHPGLYLSCALITIALSAAAWGWRRERPWILASWLCYLILLAPVLGFIKTGNTAANDRYTYLACLPWAVLAGAFLRTRRDWSLPAGAIILLLGALTWRQTGFWRDSVSLWEHSVAVAPGSSTAHGNLAAAYEDAGRPADAARERELSRRSPAAEYHELGAACYARGDWAGAERFFSWAAEIDPGLAATQNDLGLALCRLDRCDRAVAHLEFALRLEPAFAEARTNLAAARRMSGNP